jgi:hypothetical protein
MTAGMEGSPDFAHRLKLREAMSGKRFYTFQHLARRPEESGLRRWETLRAGGSWEQPTARFHPARYPISDAIGCGDIRGYSREPPVDQFSSRTFAIR